MRIATSMLVAAALISSAAADVKIKSRTGVAGQQMESTTLAKGQRQRTEMTMPMGMGTMVTITQCDVKRVIQYNPRTNACYITPMDDDVPSANTPAAEARSRRGGVVTFTTKLSDTGERQKMFGYEARRIKSSMSSEPGPGACMKERVNMETDGWYVDFPGITACARPDTNTMRQPEGPECSDRYRWQHSGTGRLGFPVKLTTTMRDRGETMTMTQETVELSTATLEASLFEIPANCKQVSSYQELMRGSMPSMAEVMRDAQRQAQQEAGQEEQAPPEPDAETAMAKARAMGAAAPTQKRTGVLRIGVTPIEGVQIADVSADELRMQMIETFNNASQRLEAVPLDSTNMADVVDEAREKGADYILFSRFTATKEAAGRKLGGMLGRATGMGDVAPKIEATVAFRLYQTGEDAPKLESTATSRKPAEPEVSLGSALQREAAAVLEQIRKDQASATKPQ